MTTAPRPLPGAGPFPLAVLYQLLRLTRGHGLGSSVR